MSEIEKNALAGILPSNRQALEYARSILTPEHFDHKSIDRVIYTLLDMYAERYDDILPKKYLQDLLSKRGFDPAKTLLYTETFEAYINLSVSYSEFKYAVDSLQENFHKRQVGEIFATAYQIFEESAEVEGVTVSGPQAATDYFVSRSSDLDYLDPDNEVIEGDVREESEAFLEAYKDRASKGTSYGILSGINSLDQSTGGLQNGELCLIAAFTNAGKTHLSTQWAWHASVKQGKNVFFATSETVRDQVWRRFIARHSREPQFGIPQGLNVKNIKDGSLTDDEFGVLQDVLKDLRSDSYGKFHIMQIPSNGTLTFLQNRLLRQQKIWNVDLGVCDYLPLLKPESKRANEREEFNDILRRIKPFLTSFDQGRGLPFISPWQINREAYKTAVNFGEYLLGSLSDTSEAEKTADLIVSLLRRNPTDNEAIFQELKVRDSATMLPVTLYLDYRNSYLGESQGSFVAPSSGFSEVGGGFSPAGLL